METINYKGYEIELEQDSYAESPDEWDNEDGFFIVYDHRDFYIKRNGFDPEGIFEHVEETKKFFYDGHYVFPLYAYIHSGVNLSLGRSEYPFTDSWDTSYRGFVLIKRQKYNWNREQAKKCALSIVDEWNTYLSGNVWYYNIDNVHSLGGIYGYEYAISEAKSNIDFYIEDKKKDFLKHKKVEIKNKVPFNNRTEFASLQGI